MDESPSTTLESKIATLLSLEDSSAAIKAFELSAELPEPGTRVADATARVLFDIGFRLERFERNGDAVITYRRALRYPVIDINLVAGTWFRIALLADRSGAWIEARAGFRKALELAPSWFYMAALARYHLANLAAAEEDYTEAAALYLTLESGPAHPEIQSEKVVLELGRCLLRSGERGSAREKLERLLELFADSPLAVEAYKLLAEIHEQDGASADAVQVYQRIVASAHAEPALKAAAAHRVAALHSKTGGAR